jgi:hypothetical protein
LASDLPNHPTQRATLNLLHITDQNVTNIRRILIAPLRSPAWKYRGQLKTDRTEESNSVAPTRVFRIRSNCKRLASNDLRRRKNAEQNRKSKIPERQTNFDTGSSKLDDHNWPAERGYRNRNSAGHWKSCRTTSSRTGGRRTLAVALVAYGRATAAHGARVFCVPDSLGGEKPVAFGPACRLREKPRGFTKATDESRAGSLFA